MMCVIFFCCLLFISIMKVNWPVFIFYFLFFIFSKFSFRAFLFAFTDFPEQDLPAMLYVILLNGILRKQRRTQFLVFAFFF